MAGAPAGGDRGRQPLPEGARSAILCGSNADRPSEWTASHCSTGCFPFGWLARVVTGRANAVAAQNGSQASEGPLAASALRRCGRTLAGTPGGTRNPNLLIRRSPSGVQARPQPSAEPETTGFRVHRRPRVSGRVHREWLPTWLPRGHRASENLYFRESGGIHSASSLRSKSFAASEVSKSTQVTK